MFIDSGFYAYTAQRIKEGKILYKDVWEAKFPAIYYIYTFLFTFLPESRWTLFLSDVILTFLTLFVINLIFKNFSLDKYYLFTLPFLLTIYRVYPSYSGGNLNEHYFIFFFLLTYYLLTKKESSKLNSFFTGITFLFSCMFKQSFILFMIVLAFFYRKKIYENFISFLTGLFLPLLFFVYVILKGYPESIDCTIFYPLYWSKKESKTFLEFILNLKTYLKNSPLVQLFILFLIVLFQKEKRLKMEIIIFVFISLLIIFKTPASHPHYGLIFFIPVVLALIYLLNNLQHKKIIIFTLIFLTLIPAKYIYLKIKDSLKALKIIFIDKDFRCASSPVAFIIINNLKDGETFIMNAPDPTVYFLTRTKSPIRFINFDYYIDEYYKEELKKEIRENPPDYIYWDRPISELERIFSLTKNEYYLEKIYNNLYKFKLKRKF